MAIDRTVKFTVRLNMLNPAHVTINKVLNELNLDIFKSKNQFFIDAATYYIENYGQEELTQPKKEKEPEFVSTEDMEAIEERIRQAAKEEARQEANKEVMTMVGSLLAAIQTGGGAMSVMNKADAAMETGTKSGDIRNGCKIIRKGEVYEKKEFSIKVDRFKKDSFLDEAKVFFTNEINQLVLHEEDKLKVFDKNSPYLATKKIGKNNPMEEQIKADNEVRQEWNRTVDRAIVSGVSEEDISRIKKNEITEKVRYSIDLYGDRPDLLASIIKLAIAVLELLINRIMLAAVGVAEKMLDIVPEESRNIEAKTYPTMPTMSPLAKKYLSLQNIYDELQKQNEAIFAQEHKRSEQEIELSECNGAFKARKRGGLQNQIYELNKLIDNMKRYLSSIVQRHGYDNVRDFYSTYYAAKGEYADYVKDVEEWNVNHVKKNENIPTEENRTDRYQIGEERNFMRDKDKEYLIKKR